MDLSRLGEAEREAAKRKLIEREARAAIRPGERPVAAGATAAVGSGRACAAAEHAPHRRATGGALGCW